MLSWKKTLTRWATIVGTMLVTPFTALAYLIDFHAQFGGSNDGHIELTVMGLLHIEVCWGDEGGCMKDIAFAGTLPISATIESHVVEMGLTALVTVARSVEQQILAGSLTGRVVSGNAPVERLLSAESQLLNVVQPVGTFDPEVTLAIVYTLATELQPYHFHYGTWSLNPSTNTFAWLLMAN